MIVDSDIVPECIVRPGSFGGLMALYESNYLRLVHLLGTTQFQVCEMKSCSPDDQDLFLSIESATRYTLDLRMTYLFDEPGGAIAEPDLCIRVYHDARMTEVVSWARQHRHVVLRRLHGRAAGHLGRRWGRNMVLSKWLDFLLDRSHSFAPVEHRQKTALV